MIPGVRDRYDKTMRNDAEKVNKCAQGWRQLPFLAGLPPYPGYLFSGNQGKNEVKMGFFDKKATFLESIFLCSF
jgi:hypothetical protein